MLLRAPFWHWTKPYFYCNTFLFSFNCNLCVIMSVVSFWHWKELTETCHLIYYTHIRPTWHFGSKPSISSIFLPRVNRSNSQSCKANSTFCFASSQVWSEHRMETTSWDPCPAASPRQRTSPHPPLTSRTSSTRAWGTPGQSREVVTPGGFRRDPQIQLIASHTDTLSPRDPQTHRQTPPSTQSVNIGKATSTTVTVSRWSIMTAAITAAAIAMTMTTDMGRSRGNISAGDGRNVCKGNFSF